MDERRGGLEKEECNGSDSASFILTAAWASCEVWKHNTDENPIDSRRFCLHKLHSASALQAVREENFVALPRNSFTDGQQWQVAILNANRCGFTAQQKGWPSGHYRTILLVTSSCSMSDQLFLFIRERPRMVFIVWFITVLNNSCTCIKNFVLKCRAEYFCFLLISVLIYSWTENII